jgi:hypothetical protein
MSKLCKHSRFEYWRHFVYTILLIWYKITVVLLKPCAVLVPTSKSQGAQPGYSLQSVGGA